jgi:hypothetical protein
MKNLRIGLTPLFLALITTVYAQDVAKPILPIEITGSIDSYFRYNLNSTNDATNGGAIAPPTSFANTAGFSLGMANVVLSHSSERAGFVGDLVLGPRGEEAVFGSEPPSNIVNQLYVYLNVSDKATLTLGNFNTFLGYEVISPTGNFNYSTSYMFSYGPFSHTGFKLDYAADNGLSFMGGVFNVTDATESNPTNNYFGGLQLGFSKDAGSVYLNSLFDKDFFQIDLTAGYDVTDNLYLGINSTSASDNFVGVAGYVQLATSDALSFGVRAEQFVDKGLGLLTLDESVFELTVSANYKVENLTFIPEIRFDTFSEEDFVVTEIDATGTPELGKSLSSFILAAYYTF